MTKLEAIRARCEELESLGFNRSGSERDRAWLLARVDELAKALHDVETGAIDAVDHGYVVEACWCWDEKTVGHDDKPHGDYCRNARAALAALDEEET